MTGKKSGKKTAKREPRRKRTKKVRAAPAARSKLYDEGEVHFAPTYPWPLRPYQQKAADKLDAGIKRFLLPWHRRAGKDVFALTISRRECQRRIGGYVHFFPKHVQARRAIWNGIDPKKGAKFIDIAFSDIEFDRNNTEMLIEMANGATWQLLGSDNYDRVVGSNIVGAAFSEFALCDPRAWDFIRPIILENDGWVMFISTFRGRNHMWQMVQQLKDNPDYYVDVRTVEDTTDIHGNRIITDADIEAERASGMSEALIQQEYYCNPEAIADGAVYGRQVEHLRRDVDRHRGSWNPQKPVYAIWNLDIPIFASCILAQAGDPPTVLDARTWHFVTLGEAVANVYRCRWPVQQHIIDGSQADLIGRFADLDIRPNVLRTRSDATAAILTQNLLDRLHIDRARCELLLDALGGYVRRERFESQAADLVYSEDHVTSWHRQLVFPLETWAQWAYFSHGNQWGPPPDYSQLDKAARTIL